MAIFTWIEDDENDGYGHVTGGYIFLRLNWDMSVDKSLICSPIVSKKSKEERTIWLANFLCNFSKSQNLVVCLLA